MKIDLFKATVWKYYKTHKRDLPWRHTTDPYRILVSEIMLQQTQAGRVIRKYEEFITHFPTIQSLANAKKNEVLKLWQGLGYNRRALALKKSAEIIHKELKDIFPDDFESLIELPGIGPATAGDILAFAFNKAVPVIETNIRTVFIHHFFPRSKNVSDKKLLPVIEKCLDEKNPREWTAALMDYGAFLKQTEGNASRRSKHYTRQSSFKGSHRQMRARALRVLLKEPKATISTISSKLAIPEEKAGQIFEQLLNEGFI